MINSQFFVIQRRVVTVIQRRVVTAEHCRVAFADKLPLRRMRELKHLKKAGRYHCVTCTLLTEVINTANMLPEESLVVSRTLYLGEYCLVEFVLHCDEMLATHSSDAFLSL